MSPQILADKLTAMLAMSTPEELAKMLYQLTLMKVDFDRSESHKKTWRILFSKISARLAIQTMQWGSE